MRSISLLRMVFVVALLFGGAVAVRAGDEVRVTVLVILGSTDPKAETAEDLEDIARELRKKDKSLHGFRVSTTTCKTVPVGGKEQFPLVDDKVVVVVVIRGVGADDKVQLKIKPPGVNEIHYSCCCGKYFPIMTGHYTRDRKERIIVAVMADPCRVKK